MNERAKEILSDCARWIGQAAHEWKEGIADHPEAHVYTFVLGAVSAVVVRWII